MLWTNCEHFNIGNWDLTLFALFFFSEWSRDHHVLEEGSRRLRFGLGYPCFGLLDRLCCCYYILVLYHLFSFFVSFSFDPVLGTHYIYLHCYLQTLIIRLMSLSSLVLLCLAFCLVRFGFRSLLLFWGTWLRLDRWMVVFLLVVDYLTKLDVD